MVKIRNMQDLDAIKERLLPEMKSRSWSEEGSPGKGRKILVCVGGGCLASGSLKIYDAFVDAVKEQGVADEVDVIKTGCMGPCAGGPVVKVMPDGIFYQNLTVEKAAEVVEKHIKNGEILKELTFELPNGDHVSEMKDIEYFNRQEKVVLRNCGIVDPLNIDEYIARDGYQALGKVVSSLKEDEVIEEVLNSGLRGRGGGGFPTGLKWKFTRQASATPKSVVCNADEGDPGAFMDRSVLEGDPHSVIEGMAIAGYAIGATRGYVYCRAEYPVAVSRLTTAIEQAREYGLLGKDVMGSGMDFDLEIRMGSGAFVCGEETALMTSIEGHRGEPRPRPPFPANEGLWKLPTLLNNVETFANIPEIILKGAKWYAAMGTEKSKGTKVFALAGAVNNTGLVEVPIGIQLGELIYDIGGGIVNGKPFKAAQIGGPSGGCIPKSHLNVSLDYESLTGLGAIMGSGGLIVMDEETCMVDVARFFLEFVQEESCGKCVPCRVGTKRLLEILTRICNGEGEEGDIERLIELGEKIKETALCGLGKTAANPVLSTIRYFRDEYEAHIRDKHCPAGICPALVRAPCQSACPAGVDVPGFVSLVGEKRYAEALRLHRERNPFAAACARVCFHYCEDHCRRASMDDPVAIRGVKRFMVDQEVTIQLPEVHENETNAARKIAVIGAGPAGLSCAYFLARLGYRPTVFEAEQRPGGMMVQAIPAYRLPREILAREIRMMERIGVQIETGVRVGTDKTLAQLWDEGYEAVFYGVGAPLSTRMKIDGEDAEGVVGALEFLRQYNIRGSVPVGKQVVICGGGNAAIDAARTAIRLDAESVTVVYRRTRGEMPAYAEEIEEAENEGVKLCMLANPMAVVTKDGKVTGLKCKMMRLGDFDRSGRRRPEAIDEEEIVIPADQVISAIGQGLDAEEALGGPVIELNDKGFVKVNPVTCQTSDKRIFAGGDSVHGPASVIEAVADGEKAAIGIDQMLTGEQHAFWREEKVNDTAFDPDADPAEDVRKKLPLIAVDRRRNNFDEVEMPWDESTAVRQARRCLRCDYGKQTCTK